MLAMTQCYDCGLSLFSLCSWLSDLLAVIQNSVTDMLAVLNIKTNVAMKVSTHA